MKRVIVTLILIVFIFIGCSNETEVNTLNNELMEQISEKEVVINSLQTEIHKKNSKIEELESEYKNKIEDLETKIQSLNKIKNIFINQTLSDEDFILYYDQSKGLYGYKDINGNILIPPSYKFAEKFSDGLAVVFQDGKDGYIDKNNNWVIEPKFSSARSFSDGLANVRIGDKKGFIDKTGTIILEIESRESFSEGLLRINYGDYFNGKWGFLNKNGELVINAQYEEALDFSEDLAAVKKDGKWGFIDKEGKIAIDFKFDYACSFSEDIAAVNILGEWGYIYKTGVMVIQPQYDTCNNFENGKVLVKIGGKSGYMNKRGQVTWIDNETYEEGIVLSVDETDKNDDFKNFRYEMLNAIKEKDLEFLKIHIDENIKVDFGGGEGLEYFFEVWKLNENSEASEFWLTFEKTLELGSTIHTDNGTTYFWVPYIFTEFPDNYDPFDYSVCIDQNVSVYSKPELNSNIILQLNYNIIKTIDRINNDGILWCKIQLPSGERGYVNSKFIRSPIDFRARFIQEDGIWKMNCFIAGD